MKLQHIIASMLALVINAEAYAQASTLLTVSKADELSPVYVVNQCGFQIKNPSRLLKYPSQ